MSVTFAPEHVGTGRASIETWSDSEGGFAPIATFGSFREAQDNYETVVTEHGIDRTLHGAYIVAESAHPDAPSVNLSNSNACYLIDALCRADHHRVADVDLLDQDDSGPSLYGSIDAATLLALIGEALYATAGDEYLTRRLAALLSVALFAQSHSLKVAWG